MKQFRLLLPLFFLFFSTISFGQSSGSKEGLGLIVKADILLPTIITVENKNRHNSAANSDKKSFFSITIEKQFKKRQSLQLSGAYYSEDYTHYMDYKIKTNSITIVPEYKFFVLKNKPITGPYIGSYLLYINEQVRDVEYVYHIYNYNNTQLGGGFSTGYQFYIKNKIVIDALVGGGLQKVITGRNVDHQVPYWDMNLRFAINIGYKF